MITNRLDLDHERSSQDLYMKVQRRIYNHLATTWTHSPRWNYSRIIPEIRPPGLSPLRQGAGKNFRSPRSRDDGGGGYRRFHGFLIGYSGFLHRGLLIGEGARPGGVQGHQTLARCGPCWRYALEAIINIVIIISLCL